MLVHPRVAIYRHFTIPEKKNVIKTSITKKEIIKNVMGLPRFVAMFTTVQGSGSFLLLFVTYVNI